MKAVVYRGPGKVTLEEKPKPKLGKSTDCIVKVIKTTICGTDLCGNHEVGMRQNEGLGL